jgi:hypothetical protein
MYAGASGNLDVVKWLAGKGANLEAEDRVRGAVGYLLFPLAAESLL